MQMFGSSSYGKFIIYYLNLSFIIIMEETTFKTWHYLIQYSNDIQVEK